MIAPGTRRRVDGAACAAAGLVFALALTGCTHVGPKTVEVDRFDYSTAIAESWKQQTLLNIVKLRYSDLPVFVDVASVVSGYSLETSASAAAQLASSSAIQGNTVTIGGAGRFTDRPTITYVPMTGEKFMRGLLTPIDPKNIFFLIQAGYAADFVLALAVESLNGVRNRSAGGGGALRDADPEFVRALELLRDVQAAGGFGMRVEQDEAKNQTGLLFFRREGLPPDILEKAAEARRLLGLPADPKRLVLRYSPVGGSEDELSVNSRSMLQILSAFASYVDVPEAHVQDKSAPVLPEPVTTKGRIEIHSGRERPAHPFAAVQYREHWYWIDQADLRTKRALSAIVFFFTLAETGDAEHLPLVTIPAQ
jgi:hypothetical protein